MNTKPGKIDGHDFLLSSSIMIKHRIIIAIILAGLATSFVRADLKILPSEIVLTGPHATQRLIVLSEAAGRLIGDLSNQAQYLSSDAKVATVSKDGIVKAVGDGEAVVTVTHNGQRASVKLKVIKTKESFAWSFRNHVIPLMTKIGCNSGACHGALAGKGGMKLSLRGYAPQTDFFVITRQAKGRRVDKLEPGRSLILLKPTLAVSHGGGQKLEVGSADYEIFSDWIASGCPAPRDSDAVIQRLEVFPSEAVLKPGNTVQMVVRAWYSNGHAEDVTRWVKFNSSEDLVATVDAEGKVRVAGHGEAAITMWYSNLVASSRIVSPLPNTIDPKVFAAAPRNNYIDGLVLKKLAVLRIPPSPACSDEVFIRRAFLDAAGILPTPAEVQQFLTDKAADKRARLIDGLLKRPEFVDYWAYKWSDMLLVSTRKLPQPAVWAFYQYIRQAVADNKPWDQFAREILTARGSTLRNGAANYFVLHKEVTDLTETSAVTFMGMSITCCRCHNHPLEKWTQDQYWGMANLFSRVALKNGDRGGEVIVQSLPFGDVPHPRRNVAMPPTPLDYKPLAADSAVDRRQYFADWLTSRDNPYFARALVNRVWRAFLGRGLVEAEDDLRQTNPPTNEELLTALARDFVDHKHDVKYLIRTIMNSAAYQRSSTPLPENAADDRFYSHYLIRRLPAEVVLDAYSQVTGVATPFTQINLGASGGTAGYSAAPLGTRALQLPDSLVVSQFLDAFGRPERNQTCSCERQQDSSVGQALHLNNGTTLNAKLKAKNSVIEKWLAEKVGDDDAVRRVFMLALCRAPTAGELKKFTDLMAEAGHDKQTTRREVLEDLVWSVLTGREFMFNR
jgi:hypothetical protein